MDLIDAVTPPAPVADPCKLGRGPSEHPAKVEARYVKPYDTSIVCACTGKEFAHIPYPPKHRQTSLIRRIADEYVAAPSIIRTLKAQNALPIRFEQNAGQPVDQVNGLLMKKPIKREHRATRAILVLESPWELDEHDSNRTSVLPFIEGVAKYAGDTEVYHANFYDKRSFDKALALLCRSRADNTLVYIAAHGAKGKVAGVKIEELIFAIGALSRASNINGLMIGSCFVGHDTDMMEVFMEGTFMKWCAGYGSSCDWLAGTMIDCAILAQMLELNDEDLADRELLVDCLAGALSPFSRRFVIGGDRNDEGVALEDSIKFVVQPSGRGHRAKEVTDEVLRDYELYQY